MGTAIMYNNRLIFDCRTQKARLYRKDNHFCDVDTQRPMFVIEGDWAYSLKEKKRIFWICGNNIYMYLGGSKLSASPVMYQEERRVKRAASARPSELVSSAALEPSLTRKVIEAVQHYAEAVFRFGRISLP